MRHTLVDRLCKAHPELIIEETYIYIIKHQRIKLKLPTYIVKGFRFFDKVECLGKKALLWGVVKKEVFDIERLIVCL